MSVLSAILDAAARRPDAVAIEPADGEPITYAALIDRARWLGARLRDDGVGRGDVVGLDVDRSAEWVIGVLATWMIGAAFLPLGPAVPAGRRALMVRRAGARVVLDAEAIAARHAWNLSGVVARRPADELAYVMFTSGSTGEPRAVRIAHRGLPALVAAQIEAFALDASSRVLWLHAPVFDASVSDVCTALAAGATLVIAPAAATRSPSSLHVALDGRAITHVDLPTALLGALQVSPRLRTVVLGGEACDVEAVRRLASRVRVVVVYGPTEATVCTSLEVVDPATWDAPRIGAPIPGVRYRVVDGELWIGGPCLALDLPEWYRTGDRVTPSPRGLVFAGRADRQVKVGGRRVELDEIEAALRACGATDAAVVLRDGRLHAHVTGAVDAAALASRLPAWMLPALEHRDALPRTATGKLDRAAAELAPLWHLATGAPPDTSPFPSDSLAVLTLVAAAESRALPVTPAMLADSPAFSTLVDRLRSTPDPAPLTVRAAYDTSRERGVRCTPHAGGTVYSPGGTVYPPGAGGTVYPPGAGGTEYPPGAGGTEYPPGAVLITGITGALGSRVAREWQRRDGRPVVGLVRRGEGLRGDLALARFGLGDEHWKKLADEVEVVVHCGAAVHLSAGWEEIAPTNVGGAEEISRLCSEGRPKRWHHVSSLSVFVGTDRGAGRHAEEAEPQADAVIYGAYAATKIAAEAIARASGAQVLRLGLLVGPGTTSQLARTLRGLGKLGAVPCADVRLDVTPIDHAAAAVVALALDESAPVHHVASATGATLAQLADAMRRAGHRLDELAPDAWADRARDALADADVAMAYLSLGRVHAPDRARLRPFDLFLATGADFAVERTAARLAALGVPPPEIDDALLDHVIREALA